MPKRALIIGIGGTGKAVLTILKERLEESYGRVPDEVVLLCFDTDHLRPMDEFAGTRLNPEPQVEAGRTRDEEFQHITSPGGITMDQVFADIRAGKTIAWMRWLEHAKLDRALSAEERTILGGAQQRRPVGRTALFLRYAPIMTSLVSAIGRVYGEVGAEPAYRSREEEEKGRRLIFIVCSVAGGTGAGMFIDIANLIRHAIKRNPTWASISLSAVLVLPEAFAGLVHQMKDPTNLKPNSYASLRELDRFMRAHSSTLGYPIRYYQDDQSLTISDIQLFDHVYLVDTESRSGVGAFDLGRDPYTGVFPAVADFLAAHIDGALGDAIATQRTNAGLHYSKLDGRLYSSFNVRTFIFPVEDVIESFAYRFLRETLKSHFLPIADERQRALVVNQAQEAVDRIFSAATVAGRTNTLLVQKILAATRLIEPERVHIDWESLLSLVSISEQSFLDNESYLRDTLQYLRKRLVPTPKAPQDGGSFVRGYERLTREIEAFKNQYLGPKPHPDADEDSRVGGEWQNILSRYLDHPQYSHRQLFLEMVDAVLLDILNERDPTTDFLLESRLAYAEAFLLHLRERVRRFRQILQERWEENQADAKRRQAATEALEALAQMDRTKRQRPSVFNNKPLKAQEKYIEAEKQLVEYILQDRLYRLVLDICDTLAGDRDSRGRPGVINLALAEVASWRTTMEEVEQLLRSKERKHQQDREYKRRVKTRHYLTDESFEEELYQKYVTKVRQTVLGVVRETQAKGIEWGRTEESQALKYEIRTTWTKERAIGSQEIANKWFQGVKELFSGLRQDVTVAERLVALMRGNAARFVADCDGVFSEPFLRYNVNLNGYDPHRECYFFVKVGERADEHTRAFFQNVSRSFSDRQPKVEYSDRAETTVAATVLLIARGFRLQGLDQYRGEWEAEYRNKLASGWESLHLFPEEQNATEYEQRLESLGEADQRLRAFAPELVLCMGDEAWLRAFVRACAYGLIQTGPFVNPITGEETTEVFLKFALGGQTYRYLLSQSARVAELEPNLFSLPPNYQKARLLLDALQNFTVRRVDVANPTMHIDLRQVNEGITYYVQGLSTRDRIRILDCFIEARDETTRNPEVWWPGAVRVMKTSPDPKVRDMGALMHLILKDEIQRLQMLPGA
jgi:hypothetical protein